MIKGMHGLFYTPNAEEVRTFIRDKLGFVYNDIGDGWLIFDVPEADLGIHPADKVTHSISFYCDNIYKTVGELRSRGVEFSSDISDEGWGLLTHFRMPENLEVELYQPKYQERPRRKILKTRVVSRKPAKVRKGSRYKAKGLRPVESASAD